VIGGDTDRFLEYWNMVFPQFDHQLDGSRPTLKNRGIDTGMGLARVAAILQNADSAYTIDAMWPITKAAAEMCGVDYENAPNEQRMAVNVVADHVRALSFVISEGQVIGNTDRGYVLKRILRRAARYARSIGKTEPFIHSLVPVVVDTMGAIYPELKEKPGFVARIIEADEEQFHRTMDRGMGMIEEELAALKKSGEKVFPGELAFHLWQQEGIPHEDVREIAEDNGLSFDVAGYKAAEKKHIATSKGGAVAAGADRADLWRELVERHGATKFTGYDALEGAANIVAIVSAKSGAVERADDADATYEVVLDETPFYAEAGGQVGDRGMIITPSGQFLVSDTKKTPGGMYRHVGKLAEGKITVGEVAKPRVDAMLRGATEANHSATHLMQGALKRVLGAHVTQRGSLVNEGGLRFDFTHLEPLSQGQIREIEELVNEQIRANGEVRIEVLPADQAARVPGVIAPFDERYGEKIRVVSMGRTIAGDDDSLRYWDVEYCGGTHVKQTGAIGMFAIRAEASIAQGIRRVEAVTGAGAEAYLLMARDAYRDVQSMLSVDGARVRETVAKLIEARRALESEVAALKKQLAAGDTKTILANGQSLGGGVMLYTHQFDGATQDELRHVALEVVRDAGPASVVVFGSASDGKAALCVLVGEGAKGKVHAGNTVRELAKLVGGGGGGKPDFAQAGGKQPEKLPEALAAAAGIIGGALA
jgi:alanyl-tRNA synthetase